MPNVCPLCHATGGELLYQDEKLRVVWVTDEPDYPWFIRVIWQQHVAEMTDLSAEDRNYLLSWVWKVEQAMREVAMPDKINLASLGNMVPHLHWHLIARYQTDRHFPAPIWAPAPDRPYQRPTIDAATREAFTHFIDAKKPLA